MLNIVKKFRFCSILSLFFFIKRGMSSRAFANEFPDFDSRTPVLDRANKRLLPHVEKNIREFIPKLLAHHDNRIKDPQDRHDISVYTGTTGISLMYMKLADTLKLSKYQDRARSQIEDALRVKLREYSFLLGDSGINAIGALLYKKLGNQKNVQDLINELEKFSLNVISLGLKIPDELLYGRAGYLFSLLFVEEKVAPGAINPDIIKAVISSMLQSGKTLSKKKRSSCPLLYEWHGYYLGAAHGIGGILYMLLQARKFITKEDLLSLVKPSIDYIMKVKFPSNNYPAVIGEQDADELVHWCHGAPGLIHLFCLAYEVFQDPKYLDEAHKCAEVIWKRGLLRKGYGLCHGVTGNAYGFLKIFQVTNEERYLYMAVKFAEWCFDYGKHGCRQPDNPLSLYEGMAGTIYFLLDILHPYEAAFPGFQL